MDYVTSQKSLDRSAALSRAACSYPPEDRRSDGPERLPALLAYAEKHYDRVHGIHWPTVLWKPVHILWAKEMKEQHPDGPPALPKAEAKAVRTAHRNSKLVYG